MLALKSTLWLGLAAVFGVLAFLSWRHYHSFREALDGVQFHSVSVTDEYRKFIEELDKKSETGLQTRLLRDMIPIEIAGLVGAMIGAILELV